MISVLRQARATGDEEERAAGFWNGLPPPFGYKTKAAETRDEVVKERLAIVPKEAEIVARIFALYLTGDGVRAIAATLNAEGLRHRRGGGSM